jgi:hypothetical protein
LRRAADASLAWPVSGLKSNASRISTARRIVRYRRVHIELA